MPGRGYIEGHEEALDLTTILAILQDLQEKASAVVVYEGETDGNGAIDGSSAICSGLIALADFKGSRVVILSGDYAGQSRVIDATTTAGVITPGIPFGGQILAGVKFAIISAGSNGAVEPLSGDTIADWNSGVATSGEAGEDLVTLGATGTNYKIQSLMLSLHNMTVGATITVRMYTRVNGTERGVYEETFIVGTDPDGIWVINGTVGIHNTLRVEIHSDNALDDGKSIDYDYMLEES